MGKLLLASLLKYLKYGIKGMVLKIRFSSYSSSLLSCLPVMKVNVTKCQGALIAVGFEGNQKKKSQSFTYDLMVT